MPNKHNIVHNRARARNRALRSHPTMSTAVAGSELYYGRSSFVTPSTIQSQSRTETKSAQPSFVPSGPAKLSVSHKTRIARQVSSPTTSPNGSASSVVVTRPTQSIADAVSVEVPADQLLDDRYAKVVARLASYAPKAHWTSSTCATSFCQT